MLTHQGTAVLRTQRLLLRPYVQGDEEAMYRNWSNDPEVCRYLTWAPHRDIGVTRRLVTDWEACYGSDCFYHWGITLQNELIGDIAVVGWKEYSRQATLGYCLGRRWWGQGIMTEALISVMNYLFHAIGFHRIELQHDADNPASGRVMEKAGLLYEGRSTHACRRLNGEWADLMLYGAVVDTWSKPEGGKPA